MIRITVTESLLQYFLNFINLHLRYTIGNSESVFFEISAFKQRALLTL